MNPLPRSPTCAARKCCKFWPKWFKIDILWKQKYEISQGFFKIFVIFLDLYNSFFQYFRKDVYFYVIFVERPRMRIAWPLQISWKILGVVFWTFGIWNVVKRSFIFDELLLYPQMSERINLYLFNSQSIIKQAPIFVFLGPDYMANFSPGWNLSPANWAEILLRLHDELQPGLKY